MIFILQLQMNLTDRFSQINMNVSMQINDCIGDEDLRSFVDAGLECIQQSSCVGILVDMNSRRVGLCSCSVNTTDTPLFQAYPGKHILMRPTEIPGTVGL